MESTIQEIRDECDAIVVTMAERGFVGPRCKVWIESGRDDVMIRFNWTKQSYSDGYEYIAADTLADALAKARDWIMAHPSAKDRKRQAAMKATAKAAEAWREVDDPTAEDMAARASIEAAMKALSENILTKEGEG